MIFNLKGYLFDIIFVSLLTHLPAFAKNTFFFLLLLFYIKTFLFHHNRTDVRFFFCSLFCINSRLDRQTTIDMIMMIGMQCIRKNVTKYDKIVFFFIDSELIWICINNHFGIFKLLPSLAHYSKKYLKHINYVRSSAWKIIYRQIVCIHVFDLNQVHH